MRLTEERALAIARGRPGCSWAEASSLASEVLELRRDANEAALAKVERDKAREELADAHALLDQLAVSPPAVFDLVQDLIGLLDEHGIPLGDLWAKVDAAGPPQEPRLPLGAVLDAVEFELRAAAEQYPDEADAIVNAGGVAIDAARAKLAPTAGS